MRGVWMGAKVLGARRRWWGDGEGGRNWGGEYQLEGTGKGGRDTENNKGRGKIVDA